MSPDPAASARRRRVRAGVIAAAPLVAGVGLAAALWFLGIRTEILLTSPVTTVLAVCGAAGTAGILIGTRVRRGWRERERTARAAGAEEARAAHRRFLARLDHELKNPVTAIRAALETELDRRTGVDTSPGLEIATAQAARLAALVGELRSLAALETAQIERAPVALADVVRDEVEAFEADLESRGLRREIRLHLPAAPWPLPEVAGDPDLLAVAVRNLLVNAAKFSDDGAHLEVRGGEEGGFVLVEVADTGWGMPAEEQSQAWDELWRGGRARSVDGSGLGLSLVRIVAELHGGDARLRSREGEGTSVRLRIPVSAKNASPRG